MTVQVCDGYGDINVHGYWNIVMVFSRTAMYDKGRAKHLLQLRDVICLYCMYHHCVVVGLSVGFFNMFYVICEKKNGRTHRTLHSYSFDEIAEKYTDSLVSVSCTINPRSDGRFSSHRI